MAVAAGSLLVGIVPVAQAELRVGKSYRLASDPAPFRGKDATALVANPSNPQHIVEVNSNYLSQECEYTVSRDGGNTWSTATAFRPPAPGGGEPFVPTCRASDHLADYTFQTVEFGSGDSVYAVFSTPRRTSAGGEQGSSILVAKSTDGGSTFAPAVIVVAGGLTSSTGPYYELPSLAVDPGAGTAGADRVIAAAREVTGSFEPGGDAMTSVSNDGGLTFSAPVQVEPAGEQVAGPDTVSPPVFLPDGSIAIAWRQQGQTAPIKVARSTDAGQTWGPPVETAIATNTGSNFNTNPPQPRPATGSSFPRLAVNDVTGTLYLVYNQGPAAPGAPPQGFLGADHFISPDSDVYLQRSLTQGATW
ncbi:MAG: glycoside hydrolase, partial [Actinomycetota bacterium]|nr:glycoside hydrolase [Actinomycetota bacterium]